MVNFGGAPHDSDDVQDLWYALREMGLLDADGENPQISIDDANVSLTIDDDSGPISVDDDGSSITIDTDDGPITVDIGNEPISVDDNGGSITIDTDSTEVDIVVQDVVDALEQASNISTNVDNQPISVDDNGSSITIDTDSTELDLVVQDVIDALEGAAYTDNLPQGGEHLKSRNYGLQPDGDLVGGMASGEVTSFDGQLNPSEEITVTNGFVDSDGFGTIEVFVSADEPSTSNGVKVDYTDDVQGAQDVLATRTESFTGESVDKGFETFKLETDLDGFRVRYKNNGSQSVSNIQIVVTLRLDPAFDSANYVSKNTLGDNFLRIGTNEATEGISIGSPTSLFDDLETIERTTLVDLSSSFGTSVLRDEIDTTGSANIAEDPNENGEIELSTGTTADSQIDLRSSAYGRYTPGYSAQAGIGIRVPVDVWNEGEGRWGYFGDNGSGSGFYFGYDGSNNEVFVARLVLGVEVERIYQDNWNGVDVEDILDKDFQPDDGYIYQIDFSWYGYGIINFQIVGQSTDTISGRTPRQETVTVHSIVVNEGTSIPDPNEELRVELENGVNGEDNRLAVGGRQFSVFGTVSEEKRVTSETIFNAPFDGGTWTHIMSWTRDDTNVDANARLDVKNFDFTTDETCKYAIVLNADITGTTYVSPSLTPDDESLLAVSTDGTFNGIGNGRKIYEGSVEVGGTGNSPPGEINPDVNVDFGQNGEVSLLVQGNGTAGEATTTMRLEEDW